MLKYSQEQLIALSKDIDRKVGDLRTQNDDLMGYAQNLAQSWESDSSTGNDGAYEAYMVKQNEWKVAQIELLDVLNRISRVVEDGAINMSDTDKRNAGAWMSM
ncbi:WXG100 family type VII secretion target [Nocardia sp. CA-290969]|uniref:WXG100 family type VII secretion target n=1 Tax=Nocardia sp. CA-290969 TaxID=3239986 RepID=UPI003D925574